MAALCAAATALTASAQTASVQAAQSARLAACGACHGVNGQSQLAQLPSLAGQPRLFIENQLVLIREGLREVPAMQALMAGVSDEEIVQLATHFSGQAAGRTVEKTDPVLARAGALLAKPNLCGTCHLPDYRGQQQVPRLAGQRLDYLLLSMQQFRDRPGPGRDTIMAATLRGMSDADLTQLGHHPASQPPQQVR